MSADWQEFSLTDLYDISSGLSKPAEAFGSGYPFVSFKDVFGNYFLPESLSQLVESTEKERQSGSVKRGDVFLTRTSETMHELGMSSVALKDYPNATFNGFTKRLRPKEQQTPEVYPEFIGYCLRSPTFRTNMLAFSTMSTRASLNNDMIGRLNIKLPPIHIQKDIAKVLRSLDKKIHLNTQTNQTLESIAQAIFKSWFVDFEPVKAKIAALESGSTREQAELAAICAVSGKSEEELVQLQQQNPEQYQQLVETAALFPNTMVDSELTEIPEGWEVRNYSALCKKIESGGTPKRNEESYWGGSIKWLSSGEVRDRIVIDTKEKITQEGLSNSSAKLWPRNTTVIAMYGATAGESCLLAEEMCANQACCGLIPREEYICFVYLSAMRSSQTLSEKASGSAQQNLNKGLIENHELIAPPQELAGRFEIAMHKMIVKLIENTKQNVALSQLRDSLLPKLLSGEIDLTEIQSTVA